MKQARSRLGILIILAMLLVVSSSTSASAITPHYGINAYNVERDYWPTNEWQSSDPSEHGVDTSYLDTMMTDIDESYHNIHSVVIVKDGYIVWEEYPRGLYNPTREHMIQSCTKSFTSTLIGIALHEGFIDNVSQRMVDFFPDRTIANLDSRKENITLYHMLTMSEGMYWTELEYPYSDDRNTLKQMWDSSDASQHILDQPMVRDPGEEWHYNSGMSVLLGAVLEYATGQTVEEFAEEYLFNVIGISGYTWYAMPNSGVLHTDGGLYLSSRNMARLGYLMLNNGTWNGTEIVSSDWVYDASHSNVTISSAMNYGYQWWIYPEFGFYAATGHYEQKIYVVPEDDLVVVFTANVPDDRPHPTDGYMLSYILPAVRGENEYDIKESNSLAINLSVLVILGSPLLIGMLYYQRKISQLK